jgi:hypothetical protein
VDFETSRVAEEQQENDEEEAAAGEVRPREEGKKREARKKQRLISLLSLPGLIFLGLSSEPKIKDWL